MKSAALLLSMTLLINVSMSGLQAPTDEQPHTVQLAESSKATRIKADVARRGIGPKAKVRVRLTNKTKVKGFISRIDDDSFDLEVEPEIDTQPGKDRLITIRYDEVERIQGPRSKAAQIGIGVGMTVALIAVLAAIIALEVLKYQNDHP
jgi:hypothetical protein